MSEIYDANVLFKLAFVNFIYVMACYERSKGTLCPHCLLMSGILGEFLEKGVHWGFEKSKYSVFPMEPQEQIWTGYTVLKSFIELMTSSIRHHELGGLVCRLMRVEISLVSCKYSCETYLSRRTRCSCKLQRSSGIQLPAPDQKWRTINIRMWVSHTTILQTTC